MNQTNYCIQAMCLGQRDKNSEGGGCFNFWL